VVCARDLYVQEAERQVLDTNFYQRLDRDPTVEYNNTVCDVVKEAITKGELPTTTVNLIRELKQPRRQRQGKRHFKNDFQIFQTFSR